MPTFLAEAAFTGSDSDQATGHPLIRKAQELGLGSDVLTDLLDCLDQALADWDRQEAVGILQRFGQGVPSQLWAPLVSSS